MSTQTRSDLLIIMSHLNEMSDGGKKELMQKLHQKIEQAYTICFVLENDKNLHRIGEMLRKALES